MGGVALGRLEIKAPAAGECRSLSSLSSLQAPVPGQGGPYCYNSSCRFGQAGYAVRNKAAAGECRCLSGLRSRQYQVPHEQQAGNEGTCSTHLHVLPSPNRGASGVTHPRHADAG